MKEIELTLSKREILGKKVKTLRGQGVTPVHLFGPTTKSAALQGDTVILEKVLEGESKIALISLKVDSEKKPRHVVIREVQRNTLTGELLHIDFYQVQMKEKIKMEVPVVLVGESPAAKISGNMLEHELNTLNVESLPSKLPAHIEIDVSSLINRDQSIRIKDIHLEEGVTILNQPELVVVRIATARAWKEGPEEEVKIEEPAEAAAPVEQPKQ
jgi:large subunit ribosomal protein L25